MGHACSGRQEYLPCVNAPISDPPIPKSTQKHKDDFVSLRPGERSIVKVSFRPCDEPYDYEKFKDRGIERYRMVFPIGMQFLKPVGEYGIGIGRVETHSYMIGNLKEIVAEARTAMNGNQLKGLWKSLRESLADSAWRIETVHCNHLG